MSTDDTTTQRYIKLSMLLFLLEEEDLWSLFEKAIQYGIDDGLRARSKAAFIRTAEMMFPAIEQLAIGREILEIVANPRNRDLAVHIYQSMLKVSDADITAFKAKLLPICERYSSAAFTITAIASD